MNVLILGAGNSKEKRIFNQSKGREFPADAVRLDIDPLSNPNVLWDLNNLPLPFDDDSFDEIHAYEVLEHFGRQGDAEAFFGFFNEIGRILVVGGIFHATVPQWNHQWALGDPGHTRVINRGTIVFLVKEEYEKQVGITPMTDYRRIFKANFSLSFMHEDEGSLYFALRKNSCLS